MKKGETKYYKSFFFFHFFMHKDFETKISSTSRIEKY